MHMIAQAGWPADPAVSVSYPSEFPDSLAWLTVKDHDAPQTGPIQHADTRPRRRPGAL